MDVCGIRASQCLKVERETGRKKLVIISLLYSIRYIDKRLLFSAILNYSLELEANSDILQRVIIN